MTLLILFTGSATAPVANTKGYAAASDAPARSAAASDAPVAAARSEDA